jgi:hypothetical protein
MSRAVGKSDQWYCSVGACVFGDSCLQELVNFTNTVFNDCLVAISRPDISLVVSSAVVQIFAYNV